MNLCTGGFPQPLHIPHGRNPEKPFVFPIEMGGILVPYTKAGTCRVQPFAKHKATGFLKAQPLLKLQGTHRCHRFELVMEPRNTHAYVMCKMFDPQRLVKVLAKTLNHRSNVRVKTRHECDVAKTTTLLPD